MSAPTGLAAVVEAVRDVLDATFGKPVRDGRPRPRTWPPGLVAVAVATAVLYAWLALFAATAQWLRGLDTLVVSHINGVTVPALSVPLLLGGLVWAMILLHTAALHATWWARVALALVSVVAVGMFGSQSWGEPWVLLGSGVAYLGLWVFILVRARRSYAWWELPVVGVALVVILYGPWLRPGYGSMFGVDHRLPAIQGTLETLSVLSVPALLAAGTAPAMIAVTAGESLASRPLPRRLAAVGLVALVGWRSYDIVHAALDPGPEVSWPTLLSAAVTLLMVMTLAWWFRVRSTRASLPGPGALPEIWAAYSWPLAMAVGWVVLLTAPFSVVKVLSGGTTFGTAVVDPFWRWFSMYGPQAVRMLVGLGAFVLAWRLAARQQLAGAVVLSAFFVSAVVARIGPLTGLAALGAQTPEALAALSTVLALVALVGFLVARRLTRRRAIGLATVLVLGAIYPHRNALDDPLSTLIGFSGLATLLFGLGWQLLTNADYTNDDSVAFPRSTRVLLYLANGLFALTGAAFLALSREPGAVDATDWTDLGDDMLGLPLFVASLVTALWFALGPQPYEDPDDDHG